MTVFYIEYVYPGSFVSETTTEKVGTKQLPKNLPDRTFGFRFFERTEMNDVEEKLVGKPRNYSGWYYVGKELTLEQVKSKYSDKKILISNMESNKDYYNTVCETKFGQFIPMTKEDKIFQEGVIVNQ